MKIEEVLNILNILKSKKCIEQYVSDEECISTLKRYDEEEDEGIFSE